MVVYQSKGPWKRSIIKTITNKIIIAIKADIITETKKEIKYLKVLFLIMFLVILWFGIIKMQNRNMIIKRKRANIAEMNPAAIAPWSKIACPILVNVL